MIITDNKEINIVVTGSGGFIGKHLVSILKKTTANITELHHEQLLKGEFKIPMETDYIFHLAAAGNYYTKTSPMEIIMSNILVTQHLLEQTAHIDYRAFVNFSSSSVGLTRPTFYSVTKKTAEDLCRMYHLDYGKPIVSVRPFSVTGVGEQSQHLIPKLIDSCKNGTEMQFVVLPKHDYIDVEDLIDGVLTLVKNIDRSKGRVVDLGFGASYSNGQVRDIVEHETKKKANLKVVKYMRSYDTRDWVADNNFMKSLGWKPQKYLDSSIRDMIIAND